MVQRRKKGGGGEIAWIRKPVTNKKSHNRSHSQSVEEAERKENECILGLDPEYRGGSEESKLHRRASE